MWQSNGLAYRHIGPLRVLVAARIDVIVVRVGQRECRRAPLSIQSVVGVVCIRSVVKQKNWRFLDGLSVRTVLVI